MKAFADQIRPLVYKLGTAKAAQLCGVTSRSMQLWISGHGNPNLATRTGVLVLLQAATK